jgi:glycosyltransferase involved in cell wall biosynthesis
VASQLGFLSEQRAEQASKVSLVLPAYNEVRNLRRAVEETTAFLVRMDQNFEIIIVEDGSTDGTAKMAESLAASDTRIRFMHHSERLGRGRALTEAFKQSAGSILAYMDVDLSTDIRFLESLIRAITEGNDVATGSRALPGSRVSRSLKRSMTSMIYNDLVRLLFRSSIRDHQCGFKAFSQEGLFKILDEVDSRHWFWDTEILILATRRGLSIKEFPVVWREGEKTEVSLMRDFIEMGLNMLKLWWRLNIIAREEVKT